MKMSSLLCLIAVLTAASPALGLEKQAYPMQEDLGTALLSDGSLQYYYKPCPTCSWFWAFTGWKPQDVLGSWFEIGDISTGGFGICDPVQCHNMGRHQVHV